MQKIVLFLALFISLFPPKCLAQRCNKEDSLGLIQFFESTNGNQWTESWQTSLPVSKWNGIKMSVQGRVIGIILQNNHLSGKLPDFKMAELQEMRLGFNELSGKIPNFSGLPKLQQLILTNNQFVEALPPFSRLPELWVLDISNNKIRYAIPPFQLPNVKMVNLSGNKIGGILPTFVGIPNVEKLYLQQNKLYGEIPNLSTLTKLEELNLSYNEFINPIPDINNPNLLILNLSHNRFSGNIPDFSHLPNARKLILSHNRLSGKVPDFTYLPKASDINLSFNQLEGEIPSFKALVKLFEMDISHNRLTFLGLPQHQMKPYHITFSPQDSVNLFQTQYALLMQEEKKDTSSYYNWYRNDTLITKFIRENPLLIVGRAGTYRCVIKNVNMAFELTSKKITIPNNSPLFAVNPPETKMGKKEELPIFYWNEDFYVAVPEAGKYEISLINKTDTLRIDTCLLSPYSKRKMIISRFKNVPKGVYQLLVFSKKQKFSVMQPIWIEEKRGR